MRTTRIQINALLVIIILACIAAGLMYMLIHNDLGCNSGEVLGILAAIIVALVWIAKEWAGAVPGSGNKEDNDFIPPLP